VKKLFPLLVTVKDISSDVPRSSFSEEQLERAARLILDAGGAITPPVVRKIDFNSFEVVSGHFEYYAAVKAREIDPRKGEMLGVFSIDPTREDAVSEEVLTEQIEVFKKSDLPQKPDRVSPVSMASPALEQQIKDLESRFEESIKQQFKNLESRFEEQKKKMQADYEGSVGKLQRQVSDLEDRIPKPHPLIEALNHSSKDELMHKLSLISSVKKNVLDALSKELDEREKRPFVSFRDLINRVKGLGETITINMIDEWTSRNF